MMAYGAVGCLAVVGVIAIAWVGVMVWWVA